MLILSKTNSQSILLVVECRKQAVARPVGERYVMRCPQRISNLLYIRKLENKQAPGVVGRNCIIYPHCPSNLSAIVYSDYRRHGISSGIFCSLFLSLWLLLFFALFIRPPRRFASLDTRESRGHARAAHFVRRVPASRVLREPLFSPTARPRVVESISTCSLRLK